MRRSGPRPAHRSDALTTPCGVDGFQTQPDEAELWAAHPELLLHDADGAVVVDPDWPNELVLDPTTAARREGILGLIGPEIDACAQAGFHAAGLEVAQKNAAELAPLARAELGFDLAVVEECGAYDECAAFRAVFGDSFVQIEYPDSLAEQGTTFAAVCADPERSPLTVLRDRDLLSAGERGHVREQC